jgi:PKD repeat protein
MTYKIVLDQVGDGYNLATINANFQKIADALNRMVLWRNNPDETNNTLYDDVDFNGKRIYNLPQPSHLSEPVRMVDLVALLQGVDVSTIPLPPLAPPPAEPPAPPEAPVVAAFTASPLTGTAPLAVTFTNLSTGSATGYAWDVENNGSTDYTTANATHTYSTAGTYSVKLTATKGAESDEELKTGYIVVSAAPAPPPAPSPSPSPPPPVAEFYANVTSGQAPLTVTFTDNSANTPTSWQWDVDNNGVVDYTTQNCTHTFAAAGTYAVKLTATNAYGSGTITKVGYISVTAPPVVSGPSAEFTGSPRSDTGTVHVTFTDLSTGSPTAWSWSFSDGQTSTLRNPSKTFNHSGNAANPVEYISVSLTVSNAGGSSTISKPNYITINEVLGGA